MADEASHVEAVTLDHKPGSVDQTAEDPGKFPFAAFEFDSPELAAPGLRVISPWILSGRVRARYAP